MNQFSGSVASQLRYATAVGRSYRDASHASRRSTAASGWGVEVMRAAAMIVAVALLSAWSLGAYGPLI
jgi:hypothetical protein